MEQLCIDMRPDVSAGMHLKMCSDMGLDMCIDTCTDLCIGLAKDMGMHKCVGDLA